jgi:hypothetical protein
MVQRLHRDLSFDGFARRLVYELRVEWDPSVNGDESPAKVTRQLLTVNGRPPKKGDKPECMDPKSVSPEPWRFSCRIGAISIRSPAPASVAWMGETR